jgi:K+-sensing histidine kinase KdpD
VRRLWDAERVDDATGPRLPLPPSRGISGRRRLLAATGALLGLPLLTFVLVPLRGTLADTSVLLIYLLAVVAVAVVGGLAPALAAAVASFLLANWFLTQPYYTFTVASRDAAVDLVVFVVVAAVVSVVVEFGARQRERAARREYEAVLVSELGSAQVGTLSPVTVLERVRTLYDMRTVQLREGGNPAHVLASVGADPHGRPSLEADSANGLELVAFGPPRIAEDRRMFRVLADLAARSWDEHRLALQAERAEQLAETDRVRAGLLSAVGHDLRTPLATIKAAVSSLRQQDVPWSERDRDELLETVEESTDRLDALIDNLLSMSRLQVGAVSVHPEPVSAQEAIGRALLHEERPVLVDVPEDLPLVLADPGLLDRVLANLLDNALRHSPRDHPVEVRARPGTPPATVCIDVIDHGPGVSAAQWDTIFTPFQRLGDRDASTGVGLGLAIARGFTEAMHGRLRPSSTPGGGLSMSICLPVAS